MPRIVEIGVSENKWNYFPESGNIIDGNFENYQDKLKVQAYQISQKTKFDEDIWDAWWSKKPLIVTCDHSSIGTIRDQISRPRVEIFKVIKIEPKYEAAKSTSSVVK